ncbi:MGDG synthase family glycosyltransferase [Peribacillus castrilensis]|uniref:Monogalactosyldiacylglycerol (MGDG) synthase n=1 Tax=Peribacillus simplex TaxID=1478 RepID=A0AAN2PLM6_9BACI|nr:MULTISPECIES: glycosyltransferase [Bacillaceae]MCP1094986.1 glycosyltransferase [Bacillaceae bacterium OS4b]MBD8587548.1 glycosyltransferase [Peribacillus simplex]MCF7624775.1 glycosyltransferase [Peribacillus frigoritolerans]MCP1155292.1 glycosyltransferase [Peribacillus frigoritolerans]MCT1389701.1 glycosyltransferase [Peribacillus frigoritolerans]
MKKILFLPLFRMQSGHHQVAEALMDMLKKHSNGITYKKIDLISYTNTSLEKFIANSYLTWIRYAPETYNLAYKNLFYVHSPKESVCKWYQQLFMNKMERLIAEEKPDLIVCTHGFPSYLLSQLKMKGKCSTPVINVYTDFFINNVWGSEGIDAHFLPSQEVKEKLMSKRQIPKQTMMVTGIPVHEEITKNSRVQRNSERPKILISGGNSGLGGILNLGDELKNSTDFDYLVLCGNNNKLYEEINTWNLPHIKPLPYISSRSEMNKLYEEVDAIVTKPGGVTISESLRKKLPIFVHSRLPGQEEINLQYLKQQGLVFKLNQKTPFEKQLLSILKDQSKMKKWNTSIESYHKEIELEKPEGIVEVMKLILNLNQNGTPSYLARQPKLLYS